MHKVNFVSIHEVIIPHYLFEEPAQKKFLYAIKMSAFFAILINKYFCLKNKIMLRFKKIPKGTLILAGLAAIAYYKYSKLSEEQKDNLIDTLKEKGRKFYDQYIPLGIKNLFAKKDDMSYYDDFGEHSDYSF